VAADAREKLEKQNQQLSDLEAEVGLLRRRVEQLETDREKDKKLIAQLQESLNRARTVCPPDNVLTIVHTPYILKCVHIIHIDFYTRFNQFAAYNLGTGLIGLFFKKEKRYESDR